MMLASSLRADNGIAIEVSIRCIVRICAIH